MLEFKDGDIDEIISECNGIKRNEKSWSGKDASAHIRISGKSVEFRISTSLISIEQAMLTMDREHTYSCFDELKDANESLWEEYLSRIEISDVDEETRKTFYSCLYRAFLYPHRAWELNENNEFFD